MANKLARWTWTVFGDSPS
ncbi:hypothetical protein YPPY56_4631, partial [Yersinia pestis PY-56]